MFRQLPIARLCSVLALSLAASIAAAPSALAACSCMCVDGAPLNVCTGFVNSQEQTAECNVLECPAVDEPAPDLTTAAEPEPVATIEPPHPGLHCERRSVYRPDLGRYKKYKVCRPDDDERNHRGHRRHHEEHAAELATRQERMQARWEARLARYRNHRHGDDNDNEGDS